MLFRETVAVYCENHMEHTDTYKFSLYLAGNRLRLHYKTQPVNVVCYENRRNLQIHCVQKVEF
jgi:hypothetical protein